MKYFDTPFITFFEGLSKNNSKEYFDSNRKTYEAQVKKPFSDFVSEMIQRLARHDKAINIDAGDCIFRINKDIRFSKDKTPYNTHMSANISPYGRKNKAWPGFYFQLSPEGIQIFGGAYMPEPHELVKIREAVMKDAKGFRRVLESEAFRKRYGSIQGETAKRLDPAFREAAEKEPLLFNKQFYYTASLPAKLITGDQLADELEAHFVDAEPVRKWLISAMK